MGIDIVSVFNPPKDEITDKDKLEQLVEQNNRICEDIAVYQNICIDELCEKYAENYEELGVGKEELLYLFQSLAKDIYKVYFE